MAFIENYLLKGFSKDKAIRDPEMSLASYAAAELSCLGRQEGRRAALGQTIRQKQRTGCCYGSSCVGNYGKSLEWQRLV